MEPAGRSVRISVVSIGGSGSCPHGCVPGQTWTIDSGTVPDGFCGSAYHALFPYLTTLRFGGSLPWETREDTAHVCCPDPENPVTFELAVVTDPRSCGA